MASPFERAFNPAFQQASAAAMKSLDDERQDNRFQQRMLEQRQYDAKQLEGSRAYAANLLKDSNKIDQDRIDAANKLADARTDADRKNLLKDKEAQDVATLTTSLYAIGMQPDIVSAVLHSEGVSGLRGLLAQGNAEQSQAESDWAVGGLPSERSFNEETPYGQAFRKAQAKYAGDSAAGESRVNEAGELAAQTSGRNLEEAKATFTADHPYENIPEGSTVASLKKRSEDLKQNVTEGEAYKKVLDEYETETGLSGSGMPLGQLSFLLENAKYDKSLERNIDQADAISQINMRASSNTYLGERLQLLNAEERKLVLSSSDDPNKQAAFLRTRLDRVVTNTGKTIANPSGADVVTFRLILPPAPAAEAKAGAGAGAGATPTVTPTLPLGGTPTPAAKKPVVPPPPRLEVPPVMPPLPVIPDPSAPRTEANFERMLRENPSQFGGELRGLFDSIMRNRKSNTIKKNLSPQFPPPIPDPMLNLPKR